MVARARIWLLDPEGKVVTIDIGDADRYRFEDAWLSYELHGNREGVVTWVPAHRVLRIEQWAQADRRELLRDD